MLHRIAFLLLAVGILAFVPVLADEIQQHRTQQHRDRMNREDLGDTAQRLDRQDDEKLLRRKMIERQSLNRDGDARRRLEQLEHRDRHDHHQHQAIRDEADDRQRSREHVGREIHELHRRLKHAGAAIGHLRDAGLDDVANRVAQQAESWEREIHEHEMRNQDGRQEVRELIQQIRELRAEVNELRSRIESE